MEDSEDEEIVTAPEVTEVVKDDFKKIETKEEEIKDHHFVIEENQIGV